MEKRYFIKSFKHKTVKYVVFFDSVSSSNCFSLVIFKRSHKVRTCLTGFGKPIPNKQLGESIVKSKEYFNKYGYIKNLFPLTRQ